MELLARQAVEGFITGIHKSPFHGFSVEFSEHRQYNSGESTRHIDWKLYARTDKYFVKRYEEETNLRCQIVIDTSPSMFYPKRENTNSKISFSIYAAAALIHLLRTQRDAVGLTAFAEDMELHTPSRLSQSHIQYLYQQLEEMESMKEATHTSFSKSIDEVAERVHRRSLIIIFSDAFDDPEQGNQKMFSALQHLKYNKHEVVFFHTLDKQTELNFEFKNRPYTFIDIESGKKLRINPSQVKDEYIKRMNKFRHKLDLKCGQYGIDFVEVDIQEGFHSVLENYLVKRSKIKGKTL
ncbi:MAG TPA: DUF58 domain-containing protein [Flavobacteriales bacterium]|mgnify:CR=1 FL=1|jgi:uncharacterized protein (DUF58 family)|nr:DUF58 domain-containing protein [Flavobacteriales bacterium]